MSADAEYQSLRQEILDHMKHKSELEVGYVTLSVLILAFPLARTPETNQNLNVFYYYLAPTVCVIATLFMMQLDRTVRGIATYIKVFHEDRGEGPLWETALHVVRQESLPKTEGLRKDIWLHETIVRSFLPLIIILVSLGLMLADDRKYQPYHLFLWAGFVALETILAFEWKRIFSAKEVGSAVERWKLVIRAMGNKQT